MDGKRAIALAISVCHAALAIAGCWSVALGWPEWAQNVGSLLAWMLAVMMLIAGIAVVFSNTVRKHGTKGAVDHAVSYTLAFAFILSAAAVGWEWIAATAAAGTVAGGIVRLGYALGWHRELEEDTDAPS